MVDLDDLEPDEILDVTCWCEKNVVRVPKEWIFEGRTTHCWKRACKEWDAMMTTYFEEKENGKQDNLHDK